MTDTGKPFDQDLMKFVHDARKEGMPWKEIVKTAKRDGYIATKTGRPYSAGDLCHRLLAAYPNLRSVAEYTKGERKGVVGVHRKAKAITPIRLIEVIMETNLLTKTEKFEAIKLVSEIS